jgi:alcohol dehydrogenase class IV
LGEAIDDAVRGVKDLRHRVKASQAGLLTSVGLTTCFTGAGVALSYAINSLFGTPKSWIGAVLLPHVIDIHLGSRAEKLAEAAKVLGEEIFGLSSADAAQFASERIRRIIAQLGLPARLRDFDLKLNELVEAAEAAASFEMMSHLPLPMTVDGLYDLLKRAY